MATIDVPHNVSMEEAQQLAKAKGYNVVIAVQHMPDGTSHINCL